MDLPSQLNISQHDASGRTRLWLRLVGSFEAQAAGGESVLPISKKARGLLALVAAHMPQALRRDAAAALLWSGKSREHAANSLRQALRELNTSLSACGQPGILVTSGGKLALPGHAVWVDVHDPSAIRAAPATESAANPILLCQDLQGLDPAFDAHLERLWKNLMFHQAFTPPEEELSPVESKTDVPADLAEGVAEAESQGWRITVLPFRCLGIPVESGLSLGMAEEVSAALAKFRMPRLIATGSFWENGAPVADALDRCRAFNLEYAISGTVQVSGPRVRVTVSLLDVSMNFEVIWASRFDGTMDDLFTFQERIAAQTVAQIDPELLTRRPYRHGPNTVPDSAAHQALLAGIQGIYRPDKARFFLARDELEKAIALGGSYAAPYAWLAYWYIIGMAYGWIDDPRGAAIQAGAAADQAVILDPLDARGLTIAGHVKAYLEHDIRRASTLHERAIALNPNLPVAWGLSSWSKIYSGDHQTAFDQALTAESLSPTDPHIFTVEHAAMTAKFFLGDMETADLYAASSLDRRPRHATALKVRLAIFGYLDRLQDAAACAHTLEALGLELTVDAIIARPPLREKDRMFYAEGLRRAGIRS